MEKKGTKNAAEIIARKELKLLFKSKRRIFILMIMPAVIILISLISSISVRNITENPTITKIQVLDETPSNYTHQLIGLWESIQNTEILPVNGDYNTYVSSSKLEVFVYLPTNFTDLLAQKQTAYFYIAYSENSSTYGVVASQIYQLAMSYQQQLLKSENPNIQFDRIQPLVQVVKYKGSGLPQEIASQVFIIPVYIIFFLVFPPINLVLISVTLEREQKTLETLFLQPVKRKSIIQGKVLYGMAIIGITTVLDLIAAMISVGGILIMFKGNSNQVKDFVSSALEQIGFTTVFAFILAVIIIAMNIIALSVLVSLLAKDEKEANMISGLIPMILFSSIIVVMFVPIDSYSYTVKLLLSLFPVAGILVAIYLSTIAGHVTFLGYLSLAANTLWAVFFIWITTRLSEAESILELTWGKAFGEFLRAIKVKRS